MWLLPATPAYPGIRGVEMSDRLAEVSRMDNEADDVQYAANVAMLSAQTAFARGEFVAARALSHRAGDLASALAPMTLARAARAALWAGDSQGAHDDLKVLTTPARMGRRSKRTG